MTSSSPRPNILWYCADQQRYDTRRALLANAERQRMMLLRDGARG